MDFSSLVNFSIPLLSIIWELLTVDSIYIVCLLFGGAFTIIQLLLGVGHGDGGGGLLGNVDVDVGNVDMGVGNMDVVDVHDVHIHTGAEGADSMAGNPSVFNMVTITNFLAFFGAAGLICRRGFETTPVVSLVISSPIALLVAYLSFLIIYKFLYSQQASSIASHSDYKGLTAEVITSIPEERFGEIAYVLRNSRMTSPARAVTKKAIKKGELVQIVSMGGSTAYVRPVAEFFPEKNNMEEHGITD